MGAFPSSGNSIRDKDFLPCLPETDRISQGVQDESAFSDETNHSNGKSSSCCLPKMTPSLETLLVPVSDKNRRRNQNKKDSFLPCMLSRLIKNKMKVAAEDVKKTQALPVALHAGVDTFKKSTTKEKKKDTCKVNAGNFTGKRPLSRRSKRRGIFRVKKVQNLQDMASVSEADVTQDEFFYKEDQTNPSHVSSAAVPCPPPSLATDPVLRELEESTIVSEQMYARATWQMYHRIMRFREKRGMIQKFAEPSSVQNLEKRADLYPWPSPVQLHSSHSYGEIFIMELDE